MSESVLSATYLKQDVAAALQHYNFGVFYRNAQKDDMLVLPRKLEDGDADLRFAHVLELAMHMEIASRYSRETAKYFTWAFFRNIQRSMFNRSEYQAKFDAIESQCRDFVDDKYNLGTVVVAPSLHFGDTISRDAENRTWAIFLPGRIKHDGRALALVNENDGEAVSFKSVRETAYKMATVGASNDASRQTLGEEALAPGILDITGIVLGLESRLGIRLEGRSL